MSTPETQTPTLPGPLCLQPPPHCHPKSSCLTLRAEEQRPPFQLTAPPLCSSTSSGQVCSKAALVRSQDGRKGPIPSLPNVEGKWQEAGRSLLKDTLEITGHWIHPKGTTPIAHGVLPFQSRNSKTAGKLRLNYTQGQQGHSC